MKKASELTFADSCAFPLGNGSSNIGLTKREMFAAMAMQGLLANDAPLADKSGNIKPSSIGDKLNLAVASADALIAALNAESK
jgi:hypothetical protein